MQIKKAFTFIELLIVLVIIATLAVLAVPNYQRIVENSKGAEAKIILRALSDSLWRYYLEAGDFPPNTPSVGTQTGCPRK